MKMVCAGPVSCVTVTADGAYCIAGIAEKIHVWQVATGNLLCVLTHHYQNLTCLRCTDDDSCVVSGGEDSLVVVWSLLSVLSRTSDQTMTQEPLYVWTGHSLPVTDIYVGVGGRRARVVSSSLDQTCKLWDLSSGSLLLTVMFDSSITSVAMDTPEYRLFAGSNSGTVYSVNLFSQPVKTERHISSSEVDKNVTQFQGHSKQVTCLAVSLDGSLLFSGSHDTKVKVWDISSGQCLRSIDHKGAVTNIISMLAPNTMFTHNHKPSLPIQPFKRHLYTEETRGENSDGTVGMDTVDVRISHTAQLEDRVRVTSEEWKQLLAEEKMNTGDEINLEEKVSLLKQEVAKLQKVNRELYDFTLSHLKKSSVT
ncbi:WD repeat-containing protein 18-like [Liolophura sinensis]|uniref:WD repeat-containing protein 18-like n=1 Tax=Liolophura sinensis TaxID=3198878 RepID=UPI0031596304